MARQHAVAVCEQVEGLSSLPSAVPKKKKICCPDTSRVGTMHEKYEISYSVFRADCISWWLWP